MPLGTFAFGAYTMTYNGTATGLVEGPRRLRRAYGARMLQSDYYGPDCDIEGIYTGGNVYLGMVLKEWAAIHRTMLWPWNADFGKIGTPGASLTSVASTLVLTAVAGTMAATNGPATLTASAAILAPNNDIEILMGNEARDIPVLFQLLPYNDGSANRWFSLT